LRHSPPSLLQIHTKILFDLFDFDVTEFMMHDAHKQSKASGKHQNQQHHKQQQQRVLYDLQGVVVHKGSLNAGHYIAYVSTLSAPDTNGARQQQWVRCDDEHITVVAPAEVLAADAYILFYVRK